MTSLAIFIAQHLELEMELDDAIGYSVEEVGELIASAIAEHEKADMLADSSAQDAADRATDSQRLCVHCGKTERQHSPSFMRYCLPMDAYPVTVIFTPAEPTKEKP